MHALFPNILAVPFDNTTTALHLLHPLAEVDLPLFVDDFHLETKVISDHEAFIFVLTRSPNLSFSGPSILHVWCMNFYEIVSFERIL
jgi:hypothetical protein